MREFRPRWQRYDRPTVFERFTERARQSIVFAQDEARALDHNYVGTEHILLGLLREQEGVAARVLDSLGIGIDAVRAEVRKIVGMGEAPSPSQLPLTPRSKKVLELSLREALSLGHNYIGTEHILLGLVRENQGVAARILLDLGVDDEQIRTAIIEALPAKEHVGEEAFVEGRPLTGGAVRWGMPVPGASLRRPIRWEYLVEVWGAGEADAHQERLTALGAQRWELVAVVANGDGHEWVFRRPLRSSPERPAQGA
jgi:hypothetical protein